MKHILHLIIVGIFLLNTICVSGQKVNRDYFDGEVYVKIKNEIPFTFDNTKREVNIYQKLSFLTPFIEKYRILKADAPFCFSKSETLQRIFRVYFEKAEMISQVIADLQKSGQVEYAEKIPIMRMSYTPNDPLLANSIDGQYSLYNVHAKEAWDVSRGSASTVIAVVDNAIDITHHDLGGNVSSSRDVSDEDDDPLPRAPDGGWEHGTHTSGIACAQTDNGMGIASLAFGCSLMAVKATPNDGDPENIYDGYAGIAWAVSHGAKVISCSWGGLVSSHSEAAVIDDAYAHDVIVVAAAGNDILPFITYPAAYDHVLAVASVDINDKKAFSSNFGSWIDVSAPGVSITSTLPYNSTSTTPHENYGRLSGTSMATPLVAGLCGLIRSLNPGLSNDDVVTCIKSNTDNIDDQNPAYIGMLGTGRINAYHAVECALPCNGSIDLGSSTYTVLKTQSSGTITSANTIPASVQVSLDAAVSVIIKPGFKAVSGSIFHAYIEGCGAASKIKSTDHNSDDSKSHHNSNYAKIETAGKYLIMDENSLKVYPNPFSSIINLSYTSNGTGKLRIDVTDAQGKIVKSMDGQASVKDTAMKISLNLGNIPSGIYILKVSDGTKSSVQKIIKM
jgi:subtilisin family serine protease